MSAKLRRSLTTGARALVMTGVPNIRHLQQLQMMANATQKTPDQFRIGLYPFVRDLLAYAADREHQRLASGAEDDQSDTINDAAANLASQLAIQRRPWVRRNAPRLRSRGIIVAVLSIPYQPIRNPTSCANSADFDANANIPKIPPSLQACASPGYFHTANSPADITAALNAMFDHALVTAHITN
ncbi:hypothetical protein ACVIJ6_002613 [Bradyrhizobium sp. USDA 4369]